MNIGFIGIGKLGMDAAEVMATKHKVCGYDVADRTSETVCVVPSIKDVVEGNDIVFIAVPTPHSKEYDGSTPSGHLAPKDFDYSIVKDCIIEANKYMTKDQLLVLISTVLPGTTRREFIPLITNTRFIYNPYLIAMGSVKWDMVNPEMVMIGTEDGSTTGDAKILTDFYNTIMENNPRTVIGTWDECECIKVFYNTFISTKIGLVNMIQDVAEKQGNINVDVVTDALAKSTMRIMGPKYMTAGLGDAGGCHPRDNIALRYMAQNLELGYDLFDSIMSAREIQAKNIADRLVKEANANGMSIVIHGKAFKPEVEYCVGSYSTLIGHYVKQRGYSVKYVDPIADDMTDVISEIHGPSVILWAHNRKITYDYTGQSDSTKPYCNIPDGSIIIDPWRTLESTNTVKVIHYGNTRQS
jgi:UDPglucose 6-dehydrogenase